MKLFLLFVFALAVLAREDFLSDILEKVIEKRLAASEEDQVSMWMCTVHPNAPGCGRRQLAREGRLSDILEKFIEKRVAEKQLADYRRN